MACRCKEDETAEAGRPEPVRAAVVAMHNTAEAQKRGYSISSLFVKYRTKLVGYYWAEVFGREFPLQFSFNQPHDATSIRAELIDKNGFHYSSLVHTFRVDGTRTLSLADADSFVALVPKTGPCTVSDAESQITLQAGQLALIPAAVKQVSIQGNVEIKSITPEANR